MRHEDYLVHEPPYANEYILPVQPGEYHSVWITVDQTSVHIKHTLSGEVHVAIYNRGYESEDPIDTAHGQGVAWPHKPS